MTISTCVAGLLAEGRISKGTAAEAERLYQKNFNVLKHSMGMMAAATEASERTIKTLEIAHLRKKRNALLQVKAQNDWLKRMEASKDEKGVISPRASQDEIISMDKHRVAVRNQAMGMLSGLLAKHRRNLLGEVRAKSDLSDVVDELHGRDSGSVNAKEIADAWGRTTEWLRSRFNAAGGNIAKLLDWALPQLHDARKIASAGLDAWKAETIPLLNRGKMIDWETGLPLSDQRLDELLTETWDAITTEGWDTREPGSIGGAALANTRQESRFLHFDGPDAWRTYNEKFGGAATPLDAMLAHIERLSRDIAAMERMGPNPQATLRFQQDWLKKSAMQSRDQSAKNKIVGAQKQLDRLMSEYSGSRNAPENTKIALAFSTLRSAQGASKLGGALISSISDFATMFVTARFNNIPMMKSMARYVSLLNPKNMDDRELAARLGIVSDEWINLAGAHWRFSGEEMTHEITRRLADGVLRAQGLTLHTEAGRLGFGLETLSAVAHQRNRDWDNLDDGFRAMLQRYGFDTARWDKLRSTPTRTERGMEWLFPEEIAAGPAGQRAADDLIRMVMTEMDYAILSPNLEVRERINRYDRGTWIGETQRSFFVFKAFPMTMIYLHGRRMLDMEGAGARWRYALTLMALSTGAGALSLQLNELRKGRDPRNMNSRAFMGAAMMQGGGLGIFGDLLASSTDRFGGGLARTLMGPMAQTADNFGRLTIGNIKAAIDGDDETETSVRRDLVKAVEPEIPGISLWYTRLAYERLLGDLVHEWADENVADRYARAESYAAEQGTGYWAGPGALTGLGKPVRAPDWGNASGMPRAPQYIARQEAQ